MLNDFLLFWLLPSLITLLLVIQSMRNETNKSLAQFTSSEVGTLIACSVIYPIGIVGLFIVDVWPWLIKER